MRSFGIFRKRVVEKHDDYVVIEEWLLPNKDGPYVSYGPKEDEIAWAIKRYPIPRREHEEGGELT